MGDLVDQAAVVLAQVATAGGAAVAGGAAAQLGAAFYDRAVSVLNRIRRLISGPENEDAIREALRSALEQNLVTHQELQELVADRSQIASYIGKIEVHGGSAFTNTTINTQVFNA